MSTTDVILLALLFPASFVGGIGFFYFFGWLSQQKRKPEDRYFVANGWRLLAFWGATFNIIKVIIDLIRGRAFDESYLIVAAAFLVMYLGAYWTWRRTQATRA